LDAGRLRMRKVSVSPASKNLYRTVQIACEDRQSFLIFIDEER
jgi:hypothetical protein